MDRMEGKPGTKIGVSDEVALPVPRSPSPPSSREAYASDTPDPHAYTWPSLREGKRFKDARLSAMRTHASSDMGNDDTRVLAESQAVQLAGCDLSKAHVPNDLDRLGFVNLRLEAVAILPALAAAPAVPAQETRLIHKSGIVVGGGERGAYKAPLAPTASPWNLPNATWLTGSGRGTSSGPAFVLEEDSMPNWPVELDPKTKSAPATLDAEREKQLTRRAQAERAAVMWRRSECMEGVRLGRGKSSRFCKCSMGAKDVASALGSAQMQGRIVRWGRI